MGAVFWCVGPRQDVPRSPSPVAPAPALAPVALVAVAALDENDAPEAPFCLAVLILLCFFQPCLGRASPRR